MRDSHNLDRSELEGWILHHGPAVARFLAARLPDAAVAEDLLQETFLRAWRNRVRYVDSGQLRGWLIRIADRLAVDWFRRTQREARLANTIRAHQEPRDSRPPEHRLVTIEENELLRQSLAKLSEDQQRTLLLRFFGELSFSEIAQEMGCPLGTVLSHCRRGLERLRQLLIEA